MKRLSCLFLIIFIFIGCSNSQQPIHIARDLGIVDSSTSTTAMTKRIIDAAEEYKQYAPVPRLAIYDFAFAKDLNEYKKLNGFGILYIASLNQDTLESPIEKVYFKSENGITTLELIGIVKVPVNDRIIKDVFGNNRIDYYYYLPYAITQTNGDLMIDWKKNRKEFILVKFPNDYKLDFVTKTNNKSLNEKKGIDKNYFYNFALQEFQIKLNK